MGKKVEIGWSCSTYIRDFSEFGKMGKLYDGVLPSCHFLLNGFTKEEMAKAQAEDLQLRLLEKKGQGTDYDEEPEDEEDYYEEDPEYEDEE